MNEREQVKSYPAGFKESVVRLAVESNRPLAQTARKLGVSKDTLYGWVRQYHGQPQANPETVSSEHLYEELKRLRPEVSDTEGGARHPKKSGGDVIRQQVVPRGKRLSELGENRPPHLRAHGGSVPRVDGYLAYPNSTVIGGG